MKGKKTGGGSRAGIPNKSTVDVKNLIDKVGKAHKAGDLSGMAAAISKLYERAMGVTAEREGRDGEMIIYTLPPDPYSTRTLMEFRFGKAKETVEIQDPDDKFRGLPQLILVPPTGYGKKK